MGAKRKVRMSVGVSSMLMIFVVLCFTTFGVLSYVTANADARLTQKNQQSAEAYYAADVQVEETLAAIDTQLFAARKDALREQNAQQAYSRLVGAVTVPGSDVSVAIEKEKAVASFTVPVSDGQQIKVALDVALNPSAAQRYKVTQRQLVNTQEWEDESSLDLWKGW